MTTAQDLVRDLVHGVRLLARRPMATLVAVLALALGIGANSAIFSVVDTLLLKPLPYAEPDRLLTVRENIPDFTDMLPLTEHEYFELDERAATLDGVALAGPGDVTLLEGDEPEAYAAMRVDGGFFSVLGVEPPLGRSFRPEDSQPGAPPVVILGHGLWQRRFGADPDILDRTLRMKVSTMLGAGDELSVQYQVVGVLPRDFRSPFDDEEIWLPRTLTAASANRRFHGNFVIARLASGATLGQAQTEIGSVLESVEPSHPVHQRAGRGVTVLSLPDLLVRNVRTGLLILSVAVGLVLLIACANVANLQLGQALAREGEMALRVSIGAGRGRVMRQLLTESLLLALLGGLAGLVLAWALLQALAAFSAGDIPRLDEVTIDPRVLFFTLGASILCGVLFGLAPALRASRPNLQETLKTGTRTGLGRAQARLLGALVVAEVALALVVLIGAGLTLRNFQDLQDTDYGFTADRLATVDVALSQSRYPEAFQQEAFFLDLVERARALPGVEAAAAVNTAPLTSLNTAAPIDIEGRVREEGEVWTANYRLVTPGYFEVLDVPILAGRGFDEADMGFPPRVLMVDEAFAETHFPERSPVGQRLVLPGLEQPVPIVGVVGHVQHRAMAEDRPPTFFLPVLNSPAMTLVVETTSADPLTVSEELRQLVLSMDSEQAVTVSTLGEVVDEAIARPRFNAIMLGLLAAIALLLSLSGIYAVMSYLVRQRHREIGIRMALGASERSVVGHTLRQGLTLAALGLGVGVVAAYFASRWIESQLFGVSPTDPITYAVVPLLLFAVTGLAALIPAMRATRVDPVVVLREEAP